MSDYDSTQDTLKHIKEVQKRVLDAIINLSRRAADHDQSKLDEPEKSAFDVISPRLKGLTYGSDEYQSCLEEMKPAIRHHYDLNDHHPEHWPNGIKDMSLLSLLEMICDWDAASRRHDDGDILRSVEMNQERFGYSDELKGILLNTIRELELA